MSGTDESAKAGRDKLAEGARPGRHSDDKPRNKGVWLNPQACGGGSCYGWRGSRLAVAVATWGHRRPGAHAALWGWS